MTDRQTYTHGNVKIELNSVHRNRNLGTLGNKGMDGVGILTFFQMNCTFRGKALGASSRFGRILTFPGSGTQLIF